MIEGQIKTTQDTIFNLADWGGGRNPQSKAVGKQALLYLAVGSISWYKFHGRYFDVHHNYKCTFPLTKQFHFWTNSTGRIAHVKMMYVLYALTGVAQWIESHLENRKVTGLIPGQGICLGCRPGSQLGVGCVLEATDPCFSHMDVSLLLFLPPFPSL